MQHTNCLQSSASLYMYGNQQLRSQLRRLHESLQGIETRKATSSADQGSAIGDPQQHLSRGIHTRLAGGRRTDDDVLGIKRALFLQTRREEFLAGFCMGHLRVGSRYHCCRTWHIGWIGSRFNVYVSGSVAELIFKGPGIVASNKIAVP